MQSERSSHPFNVKHSRELRQDTFTMHLRSETARKMTK